MVDQRIGKQILNYCIVAKISGGSFGSVYKAQHTHIKDRTATIKFLHTHLNSQEEHDRFLGEAALLERLNHPHILRIYDAGIDEGFPYLITEYASQGSLKDHLQHHTPRLTYVEVLTILSQVGQALHYAHQQNIVHRDLKPDNILFNARGEALLADFNIAVDTPTTSPRDARGTPAYMPPEQFDGTASKKSDQYALGCIAYELFTGRKPLILPPGLHPKLVWSLYERKHKTETPTAPRELNPNLPVHIEQAILKAMAKERADRHADVSTFITELCKTTEQCLEEGKDHFDANRCQEALVAYEQAIQLDPKCATAYNGKGETLRRLNRYEEALTAYDYAIQLDPHFVLAYRNKGNALYDLKRYQDALAAYDRTIELDPNDAYTYRNKGNALYNLKRYKEALIAYDHASQLAPNDAVAYSGKGQALHELKRYEEALAAFERTIQLAPNFVLAYRNKGNALYNLKRYKEALIAYDHASHLAPNFAVPYYNKGIVLSDLKRYQDALAAYERAIELDPNFVDASKGKEKILEILQGVQQPVSPPSHVDAGNGVIGCTVIYVILNTLCIPILSGYLLHSWWILGGAFLGEIILLFVVGCVALVTSLVYSGCSDGYDVDGYDVLSWSMILTASITWGVGWGFAGWFLNPLVSPAIHFLYLSQMLALACFLIGLIGNILVFRAALRLKNKANGY